MIFRLGVTGGIGSGKSTVCRVFNALGIPVFSADEEAKHIMDNEYDLRGALNNVVGFDLFSSGELDRIRMASVIFNDNSMLARVNHLVHPRVLDKFDSWCDQQDADYTILEAAILFEAGADDRVDKILAVTAPIEERVNRVIERNKMSRDQVLERVKNQMSDEDLLARSDYHIDNSDNSMIIPGVIEIHNIILDLIKR